MAGRALQLRFRRVAVLLAAAWVPYFAIQCPNCRGATTALARCGEPRGAGDHGKEQPGHGAHAEHADHSPVVHHHSETAPTSDHGHEHAPGSGCCQMSSRVAATGSTSAVDSTASSPPVFTALLPSKGRAPDVETHLQLARHGPPSSHSPPLFLLLQTFLC